MNLCPCCGGTHEGLDCPPTDVPREEALEALVAIEQKISRTRFRDSRVALWARRGARYGIIAAVLLHLILTVAMLANSARQPGGSLGRNFLLPLFLPSLMAVALCGAVVGAAAAIIALGVLRPIYVAVFRSIDDWEQEYGDRRPRLPPLGPAVRDG